MEKLAGKRIFIVEDDALNMAILAVTLKRAGASVIQDAWNSDTLTLLKRTLPVDIILLDLMLRHGMNGYDIFDAIYSDPQLATIPIVAVSAADPGIEIPRAQLKGFAGFIGKPIILGALPGQVAASIAGEHIWTAR